MSIPKHSIARGFTFVEMLAVVLVLSVLASVAVGLYGSTRKSSAARACRANIAAIISAESSRTLRAQSYATLATLAGGPEGLAGPPTCPLNGTSYQVVRSGTATAISDGETGAIDVTCQNAATHQTDMSTGGTNHWTQPMAAVTTDSLP